MGGSGGVTLFVLVEELEGVRHDEPTGPGDENATYRLHPAIVRACPVCVCACVFHFGVSERPPRADPVWRQVGVPLYLLHGVGVPYAALQQTVEIAPNVLQPSPERPHQKPFRGHPWVCRACVLGNTGRGREERVVIDEQRLELFEPGQLWRQQLQLVVLHPPIEVSGRERRRRGGQGRPDERKRTETSSMVSAGS